MRSEAFPRPSCRRPGRVGVRDARKIRNHARGPGGVGNSDYGEWLYDVTWFEYEREHDDLKWPATALINAHWVAVCEWGRGKNFEFIIEEFEKLLLVRTGFRLMIFAGSNQVKSEEIAERLARKVREFKGSRAEDAWLLASWEGSHDDWRFRYFTIEMKAAIPFPPPSRD